MSKQVYCPRCGRPAMILRGAIACASCDRLVNAKANPELVTDASDYADGGVRNCMGRSRDDW